MELKIADTFCYDFDDSYVTLLAMCLARLRSRFETSGDDMDLNIHTQINLIGGVTILCNGQSDYISDDKEVKSVSIYGSLGAAVDNVIHSLQGKGKSISINPRGY